MINSKSRNEIIQILIKPPSLQLLQLLQTPPHKKKLKVTPKIFLWHFCSPDVYLVRLKSRPRLLTILIESPPAGSLTALAVVVGVNAWVNKTLFLKLSLSGCYRVVDQRTGSLVSCLCLWWEWRSEWRWYPECPPLPLWVTRPGLSAGTAASRSGWTPWTWSGTPPGTRRPPWTWRHRSEALLIFYMIYVFFR